MRYTCFLLAMLFSLGCGSGSMMSGQRPISVLPTAPSIAELSPASVPVNSVPFTMTVDGTNFGPDAIVFWNGTALRTTFVTSNQLMATLTDEDLLFAGLIPVYVRTAALNSNTVTFDLTIQ
jgi:trimeric autotransporter adhesin